MNIEKMLRTLDLIFVSGECPVFWIKQFVLGILLWEGAGQDNWQTPWNIQVLYFHAPSSLCHLSHHFHLHQDTQGTSENI